MIDMEPSWLTICAQWAAIVGVPISIILLFIALRSLKIQSSRIKNSETKIDGITKIVNSIKQSYYYSGGNQYNLTILGSAINQKQIQKIYEEKAC